MGYLESIPRSHPPERDIAEQALSELQLTLDLEDLHVEAVEPAVPDGPGNLVLRFTVAGHQHAYLATVKIVHRTESIPTLRSIIEDGVMPGLLITTRMRPDQARQCKDIGLQFIDTTGNAFLRGEGLFVHVTGQGKSSDSPTRQRVSGVASTAGLRLGFLLLSWPELYLDKPYRELAKMSGVALSTVSLFFEDLKERGILIVPKKRGARRRLLEPAKLLDEWVANYPVKLRPKLAPTRFTATDAKWWREFDPTSCHAQWGGEIAAEQLTHYLKPVHSTLYLADTPTRQDNRQKLIVARRLKKDPQGTIEILNAFWRAPEGGRPSQVVPPVLVYADLIATMDPRNQDVAAKIRESVIEPTFTAC